MEYIPLKKGGVLKIGKIKGYIGELQSSAPGGDFTEWVKNLLGEEPDLTPNNIGYFYETKGYKIAVEKTRDGFLCEVLDDKEEIQFYHAGELFERVRGEGVTFLNKLLPLKSGLIDVHRLTPHPLNSLIYDENAGHINSLRISLVTSGQREQVRINPLGELVSGNTRWRASFYDRQGAICPCLDELKTEIIPDEADDLKRMISHNIYRTKSNMESAKMAMILKAEYGEEMLLRKAREEGHSLTLALLADWLDVSFQTLKRVLKIIRWIDEAGYDKELRKKLETLVNLKVYPVETLLRTARDLPEKMPPEGVERVVDLVLAEAVPNVKEGIEVYYGEVGIKEEEPEPVPIAVAKAPVPSFLNSKVEEVQEVQEVVVDPFDPKPVSTNGDSPLQTPEATQVLPDEPTEETEVTGDTEPTEVTGEWQLPEELIQLTQRLEKLDGFPWQIVRENEEPDSKKSTLFCFPFSSPEKLNTYLSGQVSEFLKSGAETSAVVAFQPKALFNGETQALLLELNTMFNEEYDSTIACWQGVVEFSNQSRKQRGELVLFALDCYSFISASQDKVLFLSL